MTVQQTIAGSGQPQPYRFTQQDYLLLDRSGAFRDYKKTELIEGVIFGLNAQYSKHARVQTLLYRALAAGCDKLDVGASAWIEVTLALPDGSMPQPDIVLTSALPPDGPVPAGDVLLVLEVADTSLSFDLGTKARVYATAGIPEYWVADVNAKMIHQMWAPAGEAYGERREVAFGERIEAATVKGWSIDPPLI